MAKTSERSSKWWVKNERTAYGKRKVQPSKKNPIRVFVCVSLTLSVCLSLTLRRVADIDFLQVGFWKNDIPSSMKSYMKTISKISYKILVPLGRRHDLAPTATTTILVTKKNSGCYWWHHQSLIWWWLKPILQHDYWL